MSRLLKAGIIGLIFFFLGVSVFILAEIHNVEVWSKLPFADNQQTENNLDNIDQSILDEIQEVVTYYKNEARPEVNLDNTNPSLTPPEELPVRGTVVITGIKDGGTGALYGLDLEVTGAEFERLQPEWNFYHGLARFQNDSLSGNFFTKLINQDPAVNSELNDSSIINLYQSEQGIYTPLESSLGASERNPAWSNDVGYLAFNKANTNIDNYSSLLNIDNWDISVIDVDLDEEIYFTRSAFMPKWVPGTDIMIYLRPDGLYSYDFDQTTENKLVSLSVEESLVAATSMIDVSPNGKYLLWSSAKTGYVAFFEITSSSDGRLSVEAISELETEGTEYYWPTFSPDSQLYVVQAIDPFDDDKGSRANPRLEIRSIYSNDILYQKDLSQFDFNALFTDAWVE